MGIERIRANKEQNWADMVVVDGPGRWVYVTGKVGFDQPRVLASGGLLAETRAAYDLIERDLATISANRSLIVKINAAMVDIDRYPEYGKIRKERFGDAPPASSTFGVAGLPAGAQIEIDAIAFIPDE